MAKQKLNIAKYFMRHSGHGNGLIIKGGVRRGKTTLISLLVMILLFRTNFVIISNVRFANYVYTKHKDRIFYITSLSQYLKHYSEIPYGKPMLLVWDDAQAHDGMTSKDVMSKEGKRLAQFLIFIGKLQTSYIYVAHQDYIPKSILQGFEPMFIYKINRESFVLSSEFFSRDTDVYSDTNHRIVKMPKIEFIKTYNIFTRELKLIIPEDNNKYLRILSTAFTDFEFDVDMKKLNDRLSEFDVGENTKEAVADFLKKNYKIKSEFDFLKELTYEQILLALFIKKETLVSTGLLIRDLFNPKIIAIANKKLEEIGFKKLNKKNLKGN